MSSAVAPTLKISARPGTHAKVSMQIDFDASEVFTGREDLDAAAGPLFGTLLDVRSGLRTWGRLLGEGAESVVRVGESP